MQGVVANGNTEDYKEDEYPYNERSNQLQNAEVVITTSTPTKKD
jgi:hypothetical protein